MRLVLLIALICAGLHAQAVGEPAPNKTFINTWHVAAGIDEIADYLPQRVVLLDWFGAT